MARAWRVQSSPMFEVSQGAKTPSLMLHGGAFIDFIKFFQSLDSEFIEGAGVVVLYEALSEASSTAAALRE